MWYAEAKRIYIQPFGKLPEALLETLKDALEATFKKETLVFPDAPLPLDTYSRDRKQCDSTAILAKMARMHFDGMALGVIEADLFASALNFVFGEADPVEGMAVISLARLKEEFYGGGPGWKLLLLRAQKEAVHEVGHLYGLSHCTDRRCVMFFSETLEETDNKSARFCPECEARKTMPAG